MNLRNLFIANAVVTLGFGGIFVVAPTVLLSLHGITEGAGEQLMGRFFGTELLFVCLLTWLVRNAEDSTARRSIVIGQAIAAVIGAIVAIIGTASGVMSAVGAVPIVVYVFFAVAYGYFWLGKRSSS